VTASLDLLSLLPAVERIAQQAGEVILPYFSASVSFDAKADGSPVTQADKAADSLIQQALRELTPSIAILSEEMDQPLTPEQRLSLSTLWLVDPLDGTRQFIRGDAGFSVNIALIVNHQPILGVVYSPVDGIGYSALSGQGAWRWQGEKRNTIQVSAIAQPMRVVTGFSATRRGEKTRAFLSALPSYELIELGSSLKICRIAEGLADVYPRFGLTSEWDTAAAQVVLNEAGGALCGLDGQALTYNARDTLENPPFLAVGDPSYPWPLEVVKTL
jgi:3'(2'), 5'-bisphosphate nucleotidase